MQYSQVGFTTDPIDDRSTMYTSDVGTLLQEGGGLVKIEEPSGDGEREREREGKTQI